MICGAAALVLLRAHARDGLLPNRVQRRLEHLREQLPTMFAGRISKTALWMLPGWILESTILQVAAQTLGTELSLSAAIAVTAFTILFQVFRVTPDGTGVYEASMIGAVCSVGVSWQEGLALTVLTNIIKFADSYTISVIGSDGTAAVSASGIEMGTGWASGPSAGTGSASDTATGAMMGQKKTGGLMIPTGLSYKTEGPTAPDGYYHPTTNREIYQKISTDYQEIAKLTNVIRDGQPFPAVEIWLPCEAGSHSRICGPSRTLWAFAAGSTAATYLPRLGSVLRVRHLPQLSD